MKTDGAAIRPLELTDLEEAVAVLQTLNRDTPEDIIRGRLEAILSQHPHYHIFGAFVGGRLAGVAGAWIATKVWCGLYLEIDNLVVDPAFRDRGLGTQLIGHLEELALARGCTIMTIDSYATNHASHRLYHRLGFEIWSFHFIKAIGDWRGRAP